MCLHHIHTVVISHLHAQAALRAVLLSTAAAAGTVTVAANVPAANSTFFSVDDSRIRSDAKIKCIPASTVNADTGTDQPA
jgi:hypothetical protein